MTVRAYLFGVIFAIFAAYSAADAQSLPADWECANTPFQTPRMIPDGERPVLSRELRKPVVKQPANRSTYKLNMVKIEPGTFKLGSPRTEAKRERFEGPVQTVSIDYAFEVGAYEVTFDDWATCLAGGGCGGYNPEDMGWGKDRRPVVNISWDDAQSYIRWLNSVTGKKYRLLSEAEWEYVARAGTDTPFYTGLTIDSSQANFNGKFPYMLGEKGKYRSKTLPVGSFKPNAYGVYDILGNAFEWTQDCWNDSHSGAPNDGSARAEGDCKFRLMKGGSWVNHAFQIRSAKRTRYDKSFRYEDYGFRIARTID